MMAWSVSQHFYEFDAKKCLISYLCGTIYEYRRTFPMKDRA